MNEVERCFVAFIPRNNETIMNEAISIKEKPIAEPLDLRARVRALG
jgi:hypothetical protein